MLGIRELPLTEVTTKLWLWNGISLSSRVTVSVPLISQGTLAETVAD